ncbi:hypothetical protein MY4038_008340 [Beauveria bassiana]
MASQTVIQPPGDGYTTSPSHPRSRDADSLRPKWTGWVGQKGVDSPVMPSEPAVLSDASEARPAGPSAVFDVIEPVLTCRCECIALKSILPYRKMADDVLKFFQFISNFITLSGGITLTHALGRETGPGKANWMAASYSITQSTFVLVSGRLGAIYGHHRLSLIGLGMFGIFSIVNGFFRSFASFVAVRALSGIGGGIYMPNAITALGLMVPPGPTRTLLYGIFAAAPPLGGLVGALFAGLCAKWEGMWSWTVLFGALGVISVASCIFLAVILPEERPVDPKGKLDTFGACLGLSGLLLFNIAWSQAPAIGWSMPSEIAILTVSVVVFVGFLFWEHRVASAPITPLHIFRAPTFLAMIFVVLFSYMSFGIALWYSISWQQTLRQLSVFQIAVNLIPFGLGSTAAVGLAAYLLPRVEAKLVMATYWAQVFPAMLLCGCCPDFVYLAAQVIASNSVTRKHQGIASSLVGTLNLYGISLGLGFAGTIEVEVAKKSKSPLLGAAATMESSMSGFKAALYFSAALAAVGLLLDFAFVRVPKVDRQGWGDEDGEDPSL